MITKNTQHLWITIGVTAYVVTILMTYIIFGMWATIYGPFTNPNAASGYWVGNMLTSAVLIITPFAAHALTNPHHQN